MERAQSWCKLVNIRKLTGYRTMNSVCLNTLIVCHRKLKSNAEPNSCHQGTNQSGQIELKHLKHLEKIRGQLCDKNNLYTRLSKRVDKG